MMLRVIQKKLSYLLLEEHLLLVTLEVGKFLGASLHGVLKGILDVTLGNVHVLKEIGKSNF
jgi:hypothetical protein